MRYLIGLVPPFLDSIAIYLDKFLLSKYDINSTILTLYSGLFAFVSGLIILLFTGLAVTDIQSAIILIASGFFGLFYLFAYFKALTYDEGSRVGALFQFNPVLVLLLSFIFLGEQLVLQQYIGALLIVIAGFLFSVQRVKDGFFKLNKAFGYMLLSCAFSSSVYILFKIGVEQVGFWESLPYEGFGAGLATLGVLLYKDNMKLIKNVKKVVDRKAFFYMTLIEFIVRVSRYILFFALTLIPASIASVLMGFQPLILIIIGIVLSLWFPHILKEVVTKKTVGLKLFATVLIFMGLYLIFL